MGKVSNYCIIKYNGKHYVFLDIRFWVSENCWFSIYNDSICCDPLLPGPRNYTGDGVYWKCWCLVHWLYFWRDDQGFCHVPWNWSYLFQILLFAFLYNFSRNWYKSYSYIRVAIALFLSWVWEAIFFFLVWLFQRLINFFFNVVSASQFAIQTLAVVENSPRHMAANSTRTVFLSWSLTTTSHWKLNQYEHMCLIYVNFVSKYQYCFIEGFNFQRIRIPL